MKCKKEKELITLYSHGLLEGKEKDELFSHLEKCSSCKEELRETEKTIHFFDKAPVIEEREDFIFEFRRKLAGEKEKLNFVEIIFEILTYHKKKLAFAFTLIILIIGSTFSYLHFFQKERLDVDSEFVSNLELYEDYGVVENIDWLSDLEDLENIEEIDELIEEG